jgi:hypothetical protein
MEELLGCWFVDIEGQASLIFGLCLFFKVFFI